ncbi:MAG: MarC family protein [Geothrix sp.]|uniref:MarC family protein n=1 Tax=Geothrix sp. TaxID=1962974 RepID=UPI0017F944A9|nr:MarC family protein [Geothrix sp.]NWJ40185.1 MarC family protein [Geothrix sp.]WIL21807.1 MAG: MarC family protein [Geothrix sp.]
MDSSSFISAIVLLVLVTDPLGNIPLFVGLLRQVDPARRQRIIVREVLFAFAILVFFALFGQRVLKLMHLTDTSLGIAGGVILFLIALKMVFPHPEGRGADHPLHGEPFLVPLAIPFIAGPSAIATVLLLVSREPNRLWEWLGALSVAMAISAVVLGFAEKIADFLGEQVTMAFERLMGLVLTAIAIEMLLAGIQKFLLQVRVA